MSDSVYIDLAYRLTFDATLAELTSLEELLKAMMADGQIHHDVIKKLWQVYSKYCSQNWDEEIAERIVARHRQGYFEATTPWSHYYPWDDCRSQAPNRDRSSGHPAQSWAWSPRQGVYEPLSTKESSPIHHNNVGRLDFCKIYVHCSSAAER